jgi:hypothetical protein
LKGKLWSAKIILRFICEKKWEGEVSPSHLIFIDPSSEALIGSACGFSLGQHHQQTTGCSTVR